MAYTPIGLSSIIYNAPRGFLLNGKIVPSVSNNNLTVAIKGLNGNDPSITNPVYCRIGDTVRAITSVLSVTNNAGTNWFGAGSVELAGQEIDYFVYLGYNVIDGVTIGISRLSSGTQYVDFVASSTDEGGGIFSTTANATSSDCYEIIGRFAATLSAGAGYTWTVPTFSNQNLVQHPIYESRWLIWNPQVTGYSAMTVSAVNVEYAKYKVTSGICFVSLRMSCTTGGTAAAFIHVSMPFVDKTGFGISSPAGYFDLTTLPGVCSILANTNSCRFITNGGGAGAWNIGASKYCYTYLFYSI
jgi:hypothetical protein